MEQKRSCLWCDLVTGRTFYWLNLVHPLFCSSLFSVEADTNTNIWDIFERLTNLSVLVKDIFGLTVLQSFVTHQPTICESLSSSNISHDNVLFTFFCYSDFSHKWRFCLKFTFSKQPHAYIIILNIPLNPKRSRPKNVFLISVRTGVRWLVLSIQRLFYIYWEEPCAWESSVAGRDAFLFGMNKRRSGYSAEILIILNRQRKESYQQQLRHQLSVNKIKRHHISLKACFDWQVLEIWKLPCSLLIFSLFHLPCFSKKKQKNIWLCEGVCGRSALLREMARGTMNQARE